MVTGFTLMGLLSGCGGGGSSPGGDNNNPPAPPAISSISPTSVNAGSTDLALTVSGSGFVSTSVVKVGSSSEATAFVNASQLTATVPASQLASGANLSVVVVNGSQSSSTANLEVDNPAPAIASVSPTAEVLGTATLSVTVTGTGFVPATVINVNGAARTTTYTSATQVTVTLNASDTAALGTLALTAVNPTPKGGTSSALNLPVNNPPIGPLQLNPAALVVGSATPATITVTGSTFIPASVVNVNGSPRATTYVNATTLTFVATVVDQANQGPLAVTVTNPTPGGGTSPAATLTIAPPSQTPVINSVNPSSFIAGSSDSGITVYGSNFTPNSVVQWNGTQLSTGLTYYGAFALYATVPAADLATAGSASVTVSTPTANPSVSNALQVTITNPPAPTLTSIYPSGGPINTPTAITLYGSNFTGKTTVTVNGVAIPASSVSSTSTSTITATLPASSVALPGNLNIAVTTPAPGGGTSAALGYTTFLLLANKDIVYNPTDSLLYASVPVTGVGTGGNSVVGIDPVTGTIQRTIWVGSNPNKLALSTDGKQLYVGLDGAATVAQVDLTKGSVVNQFTLGGGSGMYTSPYTATYLAAVPGAPNSVVVGSSGGATAVYDSGVERANALSQSGPLCFGSSSSILYLANGGTIEQLTVGSTGITGPTTLTTLSGYSSYVNSMQYDNGRIYLSTGQVLDASSGALLGTFYSTATSPAQGPIVSDSSLGRAIVANTNYSSSGQVYIFDESTFNQVGSIPVNSVGVQGYPTNFQKIVRWGQNGIALSAAASAFTSLNQIYFFEPPLVKDLSSTPADVSISLTAPGTASTGSTISYVAKIKNNGPNQAVGVTLSEGLDSSLIINSITATQGTCGNGTEFTCDLGSLSSGASATVTVSATPTASGTLASIATAGSTSTDSVMTNNQATASTTVTGSLYGAVPVISNISPNLVQAGGADVPLTVNGFGFDDSSTVNIGADALTTTFVSATQLTATVPAADIANYGWQAVTVTNSSPGGGVSQIAPLTIYGVVNVPASGLLFDPYSRLLYATVPSTATTLTGNSVVSIDPVTGTVGTPVLVGSQPTVMAETSDGNYLYIGLSGSDSLAQFDLLHQSLKATIPLIQSSSPVQATWLATMPGNDNTLAIDTASTWGNFGIFDVSGNTGSFRPNFSGIYSGVDPVFADATHVYAFDSQTSGSEFYRYSVDANGLNLIDGTSLYGMGGFYGSIQYAGGLVYGGSGGIVNPSTTPPKQIATLPQFDFYMSGITGGGVGTIPDPSLQKEFLMMENTAGTWAYGLARYDLTTYRPEALIDMPASASSVLAQWTMMRWGQDGIAMLSSAQNYANNQPVAVVMLLRGPFVAPQLLGKSSAATLSSSPAVSLTHGAGNTMLTLAGSNFLPGVAVTWNGSYRTTTIVDATHVTIAIPASDLSAAGKASVVATNPGASASNTLQVTIN